MSEEIKVLISWYDTGRCINFNGMVYRVIGHGKDMSFLPGGRGVYETWLRLVSTKGPMTASELKQLENDNG